MAMVIDAENAQSMPMHHINTFQQPVSQPHCCGNRGDEECSPHCVFYSRCGNTFYCQQHLGAVHVCDQRCRFRSLDMSTDEILYRCTVSGFVTRNRLMIPNDITNKRTIDANFDGAMKKRAR
jgi:hypothetical protein